MRLRDGKKAGTLLLAVLLLTGCGGAADTASNVETGTAADAATIAAADTAAGTWELVSMTYNGMTVGKEDLEEMGTAMTLELLEDGTGTMDYDGTVYDLTWDDSSITMEDVADSYTLEDGVLMLANDETEMVFERPGSVAAVQEAQTGCGAYGYAYAGIRWQLWDYQNQGGLSGYKGAGAHHL